MSDREDIHHTDGTHGGLSRRTMLRLGLLAASVTQLPAGPAGAQGTKPGGHLIGKLEGPELVTDPAQYPKRFNEAPQLAELVKAGKLPRSSSASGSCWSSSLREIGKYGGTWRRGFTGPFDTSNGNRVAQNDKLLFFDYTGTKIVPNIARGWEVSPDGRITTVPPPWDEVERRAAVHRRRLRLLVRGPLSEHGAGPDPLTVMTINGKPIASGRWTPARSSSSRRTPTMRPDRPGLGVASGTTRGMGGSAWEASRRPLPQAVPPEAPQGRHRQEGRRAERRQLGDAFKNRNNACVNPDLPVVTPEDHVADQHAALRPRAKPYSVWVDTAGNQLPYIDRSR